MGETIVGWEQSQYICRAWCHRLLYIRQVIRNYFVL